MIYLYNIIGNKGLIYMIYRNLRRIIRRNLLMLFFIKTMLLLYPREPFEPFLAPELKSPLSTDVGGGVARYIAQRRRRRRSSKK